MYVICQVRKPSLTGHGPETHLLSRTLMGLFCGCYHLFHWLPHSCTGSWVRIHLLKQSHNIIQHQTNSIPHCACFVLTFACLKNIKITPVLQASLKHNLPFFSFTSISLWIVKSLILYNIYVVYHHKRANYLFPQITVTIFHTITLPMQLQNIFTQKCFDGLLFTHRAIAKASASIFFMASFSWHLKDNKLTF